MRIQVSQWAQNSWINATLHETIELKIIFLFFLFLLFRTILHRVTSIVEQLTFHQLLYSHIFAFIKFLLVTAKGASTHYLSILLNIKNHKSQTKREELKERKKVGNRCTVSDIVFFSSSYFLFFIFEQSYLYDFFVIQLGEQRPQKKIVYQNKF